MIHLATSAGYGPDGNDLRGHLHLHPQGTYFTSEGALGFYCVAPLTSNGYCLDPNPRYLSELHKAKLRKAK